MQTDPLETIYLLKLKGSLKLNFKLPFSFFIDNTFIVPSICPKTKWPDNVSPTFIAFSILTRVPFFQYLILDLDNVSLEAAITK